MEITTIGLDLAKHVFQVHGIAADGSVAVKKRLRRGQVHPFFAGLKPCLVGVEACATAHFWARQLRQLGHDVRLIPPHSTSRPISGAARTMPPMPQPFARQ